jgi:hypothetical protein
MQPMPARSPAGRKVGGTSQASIEAGIRSALADVESRDDKVTQVEIKRVEGHTVHGLVRINSGGVYNHLLLDFEASLGPKGQVSSLEVNGSQVFPKRAGKHARSAAPDIGGA